MIEGHKNKGAAHWGCKGGRPWLEAAHCVECVCKTLGAEQVHRVRIDAHVEGYCSAAFLRIVVPKVCRFPRAPAYPGGKLQ